MTGIRLNARQRDLLYERIFIRLSGIDSVWHAAREEDFETADLRAREFADMLRLVVDDLGWGGKGDQPIELQTPAEVIARVAQSILVYAEAEEVDEAKESAVLEASRGANRAVRGICRQLIERTKGSTARTSSNSKRT